MLTSSSRSFRSLVVAASVNLDSPGQPRPAAGREKGRRKGEGRRRRRGGEEEEEGGGEEGGGEREGGEEGNGKGE